MIPCKSKPQGRRYVARSMPGILPRLTLDEALDVTRIYSVAAHLSPHESLVQHRPLVSLANIVNLAVALVKQ